MVYLPGTGLDYEGVGYIKHAYMACLSPSLLSCAIVDSSITLSQLFIGHSTPSVYDYLCEASSVTGFESSIRSGPSPEARVLSVGEHPMIALYKLSKVTMHRVLFYSHYLFFMW